MNDRRGTNRDCIKRPAQSEPSYHLQQFHATLTKEEDAAIITDWRAVGGKDEVVTAFTLGAVPVGSHCCQTCERRGD